jgi:hypothetical protein
MNSRGAVTRGRDHVVSTAHLVPCCDFEATVHSVFRTACNLALDDLLITVHDASAEHTPTSVRVEAGAGASWAPQAQIGDRAQYVGGWLSFGSHRLDLRQATVWTPLAPVQSIQREAARHRLIDLEIAHQRLASAEHAPSALSDTVARDVALLRGILGREARPVHELDDVDAVVAGLIGAGPGLTPSGDDVLVGLLAALSRSGGAPWAAALQSRLRAVIDRNIHRTTDVSAHYLRLATHGHFGEPLTTLVDAVVVGAPRHRIQSRLHAVLSVGATSGADALVGVILGLTATLDYSSNKKAA